MDGLRTVAHAWRDAAADGAADAPSLFLVPAIDSTQRWARALLDALLADDEEPSPYCCAALEQTAGRGRGERSWVSASGGVYATLVFRTNGEEGLQSLPARAAVALAGVINPIVGGACRIKWPNDLVVGRRKMAGLLVDAVSAADSKPWALLGFGVNHSQRDFGAARQVATTLADERSSPPPEFPEFFAAVVVALAAAALREAPDRDWVGELRALSAHAEGDPIRARLGERTIEGSFAGFDEHGFLVVESERGREVVRSGEVFAW